MSSKRAAPTPLSAATEERICLLFAPADQPRVRNALENCVPGCWNAEGVARVHFAVLKLSGGSLKKFEDAVRLANIDCRDVLVFAGFADDIGAHKAWTPARTW